MRAPSGFGGLRLAIVAVAAAAASGVACVDSPVLGVATSASTVADYDTSTGCTTAVVLGLSRQIADEMACAMPDALVGFDSTSSLVFTNSAVLPYVDAAAKSDLDAVAATRTLQINSAFRTIAGQYLLYTWWQQGRCGIAAAAAVGTSNHETGRALDLANPSAEVTAMAGDGWAHDVPGDDVHFDHLASPDLRGEDTRAFQRLWNRNNPDDPIAEDGIYGPQTQARLRTAPATGFTEGASCAPHPTTAAEVRSIDVPDRAPPATRVHVALVFANTGTTTIPAATRLVLASGSSSALHDASWISASAVVGVNVPVAPGDLAQLAFDVMTPAVSADTPVAQRFTLDDGSTRFGAFDVAMTVTADATGQPTSGDGSEPPTGWTPPDESGSCAAGRGGGWGFVFVLGALARTRCRRRTRTAAARRPETPSRT